MGKNCGDCGEEFWGFVGNCWDLGGNCGDCGKQLWGGVVARNCEEELWGFAGDCGKESWGGIVGSVGQEWRNHCILIFIIDRL